MEDDDEEGGGRWWWGRRPSFPITVSQYIITKHTSCLMTTTQEESTTKVNLPRGKSARTTTTSNCSCCLVSVGVAQAMGSIGVLLRTGTTYTNTLGDYISLFSIKLPRKFSWG